MLRRRYPVLVGAALSIALAMPFALRQNAWFEWANPYWLLLLQREQILASGRPTYFIHTTETGMYYPIHLFYAGFTISVLAYVAALVPPSIVFSATIGASFFAAFVGILWLGRALGAAPWLATAAAALYIANPQYVAKVYTRGAWAEFVAVSMVTLLLGSAVRALDAQREGRSTTTPLAWVAVAALLLAGTHNLTMALGLPFVVVLVVAYAVTMRDNQRSVGKALVPPAIAAAVGLAISAVFTIPNLWLSGSTAITGWDYLDQVTELNTPTAVLRPHLTGLRPRVNEVPSLLLLPIAVFVVAAVVNARRREADGARFDRLDAVAAAVVVLLGVLTTWGSLWSNSTSVLHRLVPEKALRTIQFPSRLTAFLALALVVLALSLSNATATATATARLWRIGRICIVVAAVWYVAFGLVFVLAADRTSPETANDMDYGAIVAQSLPISFAPSQQTQFVLTERGTAVERPLRTISFDVDGRLDAATQIEPGTAVATNVVWSPLVRFEGADAIGRDDIGMAVIVARSPADAIAVTTRRPPPVVLGAIISVSGLGVAAWWLVARSQGAVRCRTLSIGRTRR